MKNNNKLFKFLILGNLALIGLLLFNNIVNPSREVYPLFYYKGSTYFITNEPASNSDIKSEAGAILKKTKYRWSIPEVNGESNILPIGTKLYFANDTSLVDSTRYDGLIVKLDGSYKVARPSYIGSYVEFDYGLLIKKIILFVIIIAMTSIIYYILNLRKNIRSD